MSLRIVLTEKKAKRINLNVENGYKPNGLFLWIGSVGVLDWIVGYRYGRGFEVNKCYHTGNHWTKDLFRELFSKKKGCRVTLTRYSH